MCNAEALIAESLHCIGVPCDGVAGSKWTHMDGYVDHHLAQSTKGHKPGLNISADVSVGDPKRGRWDSERAFFFPSINNAASKEFIDS